MIGWAASELQYADLGDTRRNKRLVRLVEDLAAQPNASVPQASGDLAATQAAYNFWSSPHIKAQAIREAHQRSTILARYHPDSPADTVLATHEWQALYCTIHKTPHPPPIPPSLQTCIRLIAQLGGFLGRKHDGEPGVKTIWQGLRRLHDIAQTWLLVSPISTVPVKPEFVKKDATNA